MFLKLFMGVVGNMRRNPLNSNHSLRKRQMKPLRRMFRNRPAQPQTPATFDEAMKDEIETSNTRQYREWYANPCDHDWHITARKSGACGDPECGKVHVFLIVGCPHCGSCGAVTQFDPWEVPEGLRGSDEIPLERLEVPVPWSDGERVQPAWSRGAA